MATFMLQGDGNNTDITARSTTERKPASGIDCDTDFDPLLPADAAAIVDSAQALLLACGQGPITSALKGKQLGLMCANDAVGDALKANSESSDADAFRWAATRLGAHVARIRPRLSAHSSATELHRLALMLGRLYDAVECQGMPLDLVQKIKAQAGVPVFFNLASADHPTAALVDQLQGGTSTHDKRVCVLQASLLRSLERSA
jgi:ornithine carbamoyltransferase